jgi:hypothetical protein
VVPGLTSPLGGIIISLYGCISPLPVSGASVVFRSLDVLFLLKIWLKCELLIWKLFLDASLKFVNTVNLLDSSKLEATGPA